MVSDGQNQQRYCGKYLDKYMLFFSARFADCVSGKPFCSSHYFVLPVLFFFQYLQYKAVNTGRIIMECLCAIFMPAPAIGHKVGIWRKPPDVIEDGIRAEKHKPAR